MKTLKLVFHAFRDLAVRYLPNRKNDFAFAFLVHPRDIADVYRKYPFVKYLPEALLLSALKYFWPVVLSEVEGVKDKNGRSVRGVIITLPLTAQQMLDDRNLAKKKILDAIKLAEKFGVFITGLGAFTSSITDGGKEICQFSKTFITNGNSLTAATAVSAVEKIVKSVKKKNQRKKIVLAVVGATGSIGGAVSKMLASKGDFSLMILAGRTPENLKKLNEEIKEIIPAKNAAKIKITADIKAITKADIVVVATSAKEAIIKPEYLKKNAIVYDITQPRNTSLEIKEERKDVKFIEGGLIFTPGVNYHFNFGIPKETAFACLAETMILAAERIDDHFSLGKVGPEKIKKITDLATEYNFYPYDF